MSNRPPFDEHNFVGSAVLRMGRIIDAPVTWFRGKLPDLTSTYARILLIFQSEIYGSVTNYAMPSVTPIERIVEPNRKDYNWYHQQFRRVPTIDECYIDDKVC